MTSSFVALPRLVWNHPGNRGRRFRALGRLAAWQAWQRATGRPWTITLAGVRRLQCDPHSTSASGVLYCRLPDWPEMNLILDYLRPGDGFVDVGANVGVYSLLASVVPDVRVWAFEPSKATWESACANVALNGLAGCIQVVQAAVGEKEGQVLLTVGLGTVNHVVHSAEGQPAEAAPMVTLDSYLPVDESRRVRMMKIDVEGQELEVLKGARELIRTSQPVVIAEANDVQGLAEWLSELEYRPFAYVPERRELSETTWEASPTGNIVALADVALAHQRLRSAAALGNRSD